MKISDIIKFSILNIIRNKSQILIILLLSICFSIMLFGFSYYDSIKNFWNDWTKKSYDFKIYLVEYDPSLISQDDLITKLLKEDLDDIFTYQQYRVVGTAIDYQNKNVDGALEIVGTVPKTKKILIGRDLSENENEIICPSNFLPKSRINNGEYNSKLEIDMTNKLKKYLNVKLYGSDEIEKFKIVGLYDENYDYSSTGTCYTTHKTIENLNKKYQPELFETNFSIYILTNSNTNFDSINNINGVLNTFAMQTIKTSVGDKVIVISGVLLIISYILTSSILYTIYKKNIDNKKREYGIFLSIGYTKETIKKINIFEILIIIFVSTIISIFVGFLLSVYYPKFFLANDMQLSKISINLNYWLLIINLIISYTLLSLANNMYIKNIKKSNIKNILEG